MGGLITLEMEMIILVAYSMQRPGTGLQIACPRYGDSFDKQSCAAGYGLLPLPPILNGNLGLASQRPPFGESELRSKESAEPFPSAAVALARVGTGMWCLPLSSMHNHTDPPLKREFAVCRLSLRRGGLGRTGSSEVFALARVK